MPVESFFIIKDIPTSPVVAAVTSIAIRAIEGRDFQIQLVQLPNITSNNDISDALKIVSANSQVKAARKAVSDDLTAIIMLKECYLPRFMIATGTNKAVLRRGSDE